MQTYYHGEPIKVNVAISNRSNKTIKKIKIQGRYVHSTYQLSLLRVRGSGKGEVFRFVQTFEL